MQFISNSDVILEVVDARDAIVPLFYLPLPPELSLLLGGEGDRRRVPQHARDSDPHQDRSRAPRPPRLPPPHALRRAPRPPLEKHHAAAPDALPREKARAIPRRAQNPAASQLRQLRLRTRLPHGSTLFPAVPSSVSETSRNPAGNGSTWPWSGFTAWGATKCSAPSCRIPRGTTPIS